jgi:hypothetical protein
MATLTTTQTVDTTEFDTDTLSVTAFGDGTTNNPNSYVHALGAIDGHSASTWAALADLAQWGAFRRHEYPGRDIIWTLRLSEQGVAGPGSDPALALRFDF